MEICGKRINIPWNMLVSCRKPLWIAKCASTAMIYKIVIAVNFAIIVLIAFSALDAPKQQTLWGADIAIIAFNVFVASSAEIANTAKVASIVIAVMLVKNVDIPMTFGSARDVFRAMI